MYQNWPIKPYLHNPNAKPTTLDHAVYECTLDKSIVRKIVQIGTNHKQRQGIIIGHFYLKYPGHSPLTTLTLTLGTLQPIDHQKFCLQLHAVGFPQHLVSSMTVHYVINCRQLDMDSWTSDTFTANDVDGHVLTHDSFKFYKFRKWLKLSDRPNTIKFTLNIGDITLINHSNPTQLIVASAPLDYNRRHLKLQWDIPADTVRTFKDYKDGQWIRSPLLGERFYVTLYPAGSTEPEVEFNWKPGFAQFAFDTMSTPRHLRGVNGFWNIVLLETSTHCTEIRGLIGAHKAHCSASSNSLPCSKLHELDSVTIQLELVMFRPILHNGSEIPLDYWDLRDDIPPPRPRRHDMRGSFEWTIRNDKHKMFDHFIEARLGQRFTSSVFEIGHLKWCLMVYPNGENHMDEGAVTLSLHFVDRHPVGVSLVTIKRTLYCLEFDIYDTAYFQFHVSDYRPDHIVTPRWNNIALQLQQVKEYKAFLNESITFGAKVEILQIRNIKDEVIYGRALPIEWNSQWSVQLDTVNLLKRAKTLCKTSDISLWSIETEHVDNSVQMTLFLQSIPYGLSGLTANLKCSIGEDWISIFNNNFSKTVKFSRAVTSLKIPWEISIPLKQPIVDFHVKVLYLVDLLGNVIRQHCKVSNEMYHYSMYLYKYQRAHLKAMYFLRKARRCALLFGPERDCLMADDDFYKVKRRRLNHRICKRMCGIRDKKLMCSKHVICGNESCDGPDVEGDFVYRMCAGCHSLYYCSRRCQKRHWRKHRLCC